MPVLKQEKEYLLAIFTKTIDILKNPSEVNILKIKLLESNDCLPVGLNSDKFIKRKICSFLKTCQNLPEKEQTIDVTSFVFHVT